jgi:hypothetical protein
MDGWLDDRLVGQKCAWLIGWMNGCLMDGFMYEWLDGWLEGWDVRCMVGRMD